MNIALELPYYAAYKRGADLFFEGLVKNLARWDQKNQYRIFGYFFRDYQKKCQRIFCPSQDNFQLKVRRWPESKINKLERGLKIPVIELYLKYLKTDVYLCMNPPITPRIKSIMWMSSAGPSSRDNFTLDMVRQWEERTVPGMKRAKKVIVCSEDMKREILKTADLPAENMEVIYWPVDREYLHPISDDAILEPVRNKYRLPRNNVLLCVGPFDSSLNMKNVFQAFANIRRKGIGPLCLVLAGSDEVGLQSLAQKYAIEDNVVMTGHLSPQDLAVLYNIATAVIYPSYYEELGMPLIESMTCGTPIITSNAGALPEAADGAALLTDPNSLSDMESAMTKILEDAALRKTMRENGLRRAETFTWDKAIKTYLRLFNEVGQS
jgi:glycosyltransferase involved in cell wall biosynthesis